MKSQILAVGIVLSALVLPIAAQGQIVTGTIVGGLVGGPVGAVAGGVIGALNVAAFTHYLATHTSHNSRYDGDVVVGAQLPIGRTYYQVPASYYRSAPPAYYMVLNGHTVLIDPAAGKMFTS